jgi:hypothetical protein
MALLVFSDRCQYCQEILKFIEREPSIQPVLRFWNITTQGVPTKKITRVPTLVTDEGKMMVGSEVKAWIESMIPSEIESFNNTDFTYNLDGTEELDNMFNLDRYGASLQPVLTPELEAKINENPTSAYQKRNSSN